MSQLPERFVSLMDRIGLPGLPDALAEGSPEVSVRFNRGKLPCQFEGAARVPWCDRGIYLPSRPSFTLDPAFHQGRYYVQEAASMFHSAVVEHLVTLLPPRPLRVLDACAAPGGKTTAVADVLPEGSLVVANEYVPSRAAVLRENIIKWGAPGMIVTRGDTESLSRLRDTFDIIVADVPCSGEGMMRKDPEAVAQWSEGLVAECAARQREIAANLWKALSPGGFLIYSTCTFNRSENEENVAYIIDSLGGESVGIPVEPSWAISPGIDTPHHCYRFIPGVTRGEGLFVSVIRKPGSPSLSTVSSRKEKKLGRRSKGGDAVPPQVVEWLACPERFAITSVSGRITAFPAEHAGLLKAVGEAVDVIHEGVTLATVKGRDIIPAHALAMSTALRRGTFPGVEVDRDTALRYLHGEAPTLPSGSPRGYLLLTFGSSPLGWVKNLGSRCNSLYPQPWRIRIKG